MLLMADRAATNAAIQKLLDERQQIEQWIKRLEEKPPSRVRDRVRQDYEERRNELIRELQGHADAVRDSLAEKEEARRRMGELAHTLEDRLAEAELRHEVGEYSDGEWQKVQADAGAELTAVRARLATVQEELDRLSEVVRLIESGDAAPKPDAPSQPAAATTAPPTAPVAEAPAPKAPSAQPAEARASDAQPFDELAFLKSVTEGSELPPTRRASGEHRPPAANDAEPAEQPASPFRRASTEQAQKTLRCAECGTMNLPTEWYCEQCGAELAAL